MGIDKMLKSHNDKIEPSDATKTKYSEVTDEINPTRRGRCDAGHSVQIPFGPFGRSVRWEGTKGGSPPNVNESKRECPPSKKKFREHPSAEEKLVPTSQECRHNQKAFSPTEKIHKSRFSPAKACHSMVNSPAKKTGVNSVSSKKKIHQKQSSGNTLERYFSPVERQQSKRLPISKINKTTQFKEMQAEGLQPAKKKLRFPESSKHAHPLRERDFNKGASVSTKGHQDCSSNKSYRNTTGIEKNVVPTKLPQKKQTYDDAFSFSKINNHPKLPVERNVGATAMTPKNKRKPSPSTAVTKNHKVASSMGKISHGTNSLTERNSAKATAKNQQNSRMKYAGKRSHNEAFYNERIHLRRMLDDIEKFRVQQKKHIELCIELGLIRREDFERYRRELSTQRGLSDEEANSPPGGTGDSGIEKRSEHKAMKRNYKDAFSGNRRNQCETSRVQGDQETSETMATASNITKERKGNSKPASSMKLTHKKAFSGGQMIQSNAWSQGKTADPPKKFYGESSMTDPVTTRRKIETKAGSSAKNRKYHEAFPLEGCSPVLEIKEKKRGTIANSAVKDSHRMEYSSGRYSQGTVSMREYLNRAHPKKKKKHPIECATNIFTAYRVKEKTKFYCATCAVAVTGDDAENCRLGKHRHPGQTCPICLKSLKQLKSLRNHVRTVHWMNLDYCHSNTRSDATVQEVAAQVGTEFVQDFIYQL